MGTLAVMIIIVGFMVAIIGIRQDRMMRELRAHIRWFQENVDFLEGENEDK